MVEIFARYLTPLTYLMWVMIIAGAIDHFAVGFLPRQIAEVNLYIMWPLLAVVWFGHRHAARVKAQAMRDDLIDGA
jgi:hypothetical protein